MPETASIVEAAVYRQIAENLCQRVQRGDFGERLPTLQQLATEYEVGMVTARRAIKILQDRGVVTAAPGRGILPTRLRRERTNTLGLILGDTIAPLGGKLVRGVQAAAQAASQALVTETYLSNPERILAIARRLAEQRKVDGLILWSAGEIGPVCDYLNAHLLPFVLVPEPDLEQFAHCHTVSNADSGAAADVMTHLISLGHGAIGFVGSDPQQKQSYFQHRLMRYRRSMKVAGLEAMVPVDPSAPVEELTAYLRNCRAVFCSTDRDACKVLCACLRAGIKVPEQLAVCGYDNTESAQSMNLTTVEQHFERIGAAAVELLLAELAGELRGPVHREVASELIIRESTRRPSTP